jgi:hypothetical protein
MQNMRDILRSSLGRSLRELSDEDRLAAAWPVACGTALAAHGEVLHLDPERILHIRVAGPEWMTQLLRIRSSLTNDLARIAAVPLSGIHFEEQGSVPRNPRKSPGRPRLNRPPVA